VRGVSADSAITLLGATPPASDENPACGPKSYCGEISSCAEARFHLEQCGVTHLDRDGDGVACEDLCF
jgi:hypothetical protein